MIVYQVKYENQIITWTDIHFNIQISLLKKKVKMLISDYWA